MNTLHKHFLFLAVCVSPVITSAQYWQQQADYTIHAELDTTTHIIDGTESIVYHNNSPDTLHTLYFHLYWNAFTLNSTMSEWSKQTKDFLTGDKIYKMTKDESGYQQVKEVKVNNAKIKSTTDETILAVPLTTPLLPGATTTVAIEFQARVPIAIRRAGRHTKAGIDYSICQWYPKICRYDKYGWHADPYIGREFAGTFGNYDVTIVLDKSFTVAGTGTVQDKTYLDKGYQDLAPLEKKKNKASWHFTATNVHDFAWAADADYSHASKTVDGIVFHFFYQKKEPYIKPWQQVIDAIEHAYPVARDAFGPYRYNQFCFVQAGEGSMEYPMCTFLEDGDSEGFLSTAFHEFMHAWFYGMLGSDENMYPWMDEGFTMYSDARLYDAIRHKEGENLSEESFGTYMQYRRYTTEEPASTFANYFKNSEAYVLAAYYKGQLLPEQLRYIIGEENVRNGFRRYVKEWCFRHPEPGDFIHCMEKESGMELDWFLNYWIYTTKTVDFAVESVNEDQSKTHVVLRRVGEIPLPVDLLVTFMDGSRKLYYIPLDLMYGQKPHEKNIYPYDREVMPEWKFALKKYELDISGKQVSSVEIDPLHYTADINRGNNMEKTGH